MLCAKTWIIFSMDCGWFQDSPPKPKLHMGFFCFPSSLNVTVDSFENHSHSMHWKFTAVKFSRMNSRYFYLWWWLKEKGLLLCFSLLHHLPQCPLPNSSTCVSHFWMLFWPTSAHQSSTIPCTGRSCRRWPRFTGSPSRTYHRPAACLQCSLFEEKWFCRNY